MTIEGFPIEHSERFRAQPAPRVKENLSEPMPFAGKLILAFLLWICATYAPLTANKAISIRWPVAIGFGALGFYWYLTTPKQREGLGWFGVGAGLLFLSCAMSILYSRFMDYTIGRTVGLGFVFAFTILGVGRYLSRWSRFQHLFYSFVFFSFVSAFILMITYRGDMDDVVRPQYYRFQSSEFLKATGAGILIVASLPFFAWCTKYSGPRLKKLSWLLIFVLLFLLVLTKSRGPLGTALVMLPFMHAVVTRKSRSTALFAVGALVVCAGIGVQLSDVVIKELRLGTKDVTSGRMARWGALIQSGMHSPFIGFGFGTSRFIALPSIARVSMTGEVSGIGSRFPAKFAHNEHVGLFYDLGLVGVLAFWLSILPVVACGWSLFLMRPSPERDMVLMLWCSWLTRLADTVSHDAYLTIGNPTTFIFWITACATIRGAVLLKRQQAEAQQNVRPSDEIARRPRFVENRVRP